MVRNETIKVDITVRALLNIDREKWPEDWNLFKEVGHQIGFEDAQAWHVLRVSILERQPTEPEGFLEE